MEHDENDDDDDDDDVVVVGVVKESVCVCERGRHNKWGGKSLNSKKKTMIQLTLNTERDKKGKSLSFFLSLT